MGQFSIFSAFGGLKEASLKTRTASSPAASFIGATFIGASGLLVAAAAHLEGVEDNIAPLKTTPHTSSAEGV